MLPKHKVLIWNPQAKWLEGILKTEISRMMTYGRFHGSNAPDVLGDIRPIILPSFWYPTLNCLIYHQNGWGRDYNRAYSGNDKFKRL